MQFATDIVAFRNTAARFDRPVGNSASCKVPTFQHLNTHASTRGEGRRASAVAVLCVSGCLEPVSVKTQRPVPKAAMRHASAAGRTFPRPSRPVMCSSGTLCGMGARHRHEERAESDPRQAICR